MILEIYLFPLIKNKDNSKEIITPRISFRVNPGNNMNDHSDSSREIEIGNVFDLNRLGLSSDYEAGRSLTLGLGYKFDQIENNQEDKGEVKDKYLEFKLATVIISTSNQSLSVGIVANVACIVIDPVKPL